MPGPARFGGAIRHRASRRRLFLREFPENPMGANTSWWPIRVLVVDDNRDCADSTVMLLQAVGFEAAACYDGEAALAVNQDFKPCVLST
jgi:PleD family two-component response regulator